MVLAQTTATVLDSGVGLDSGAEQDLGLTMMRGRAAVPMGPIDNESKLTMFFPDKNFRAAVFQAMKGLGNATTPVEATINAFEGSIIASGKNKPLSQKNYKFLGNRMPKARSDG